MSSTLQNISRKIFVIGPKVGFTSPILYENTCESVSKYMGSGTRVTALDPHCKVRSNPLGHDCS